MHLAIMGLSPHAAEQREKKEKMKKKKEEAKKKKEEKMEKQKLVCWFLVTGRCIDIFFSGCCSTKRRRKSEKGVHLFNQFSVSCHPPSSFHRRQRRRRRDLRAKWAGDCRL